MIRPCFRPWFSSMTLHVNKRKNETQFTLLPSFLLARISIKFFYFRSFDVLMSHQRSGKLTEFCLRIFMLSKKLLFLSDKIKVTNITVNISPVSVLTSSVRRLLGCNHVGDALNVELKVHTAGKLNVEYYCKIYVMNN